MFFKTENRCRNFFRHLIFMGKKSCESRKEWLPFSGIPCTINLGKLLYRGRYENEVFTVESV